MVAAAVQRELGEIRKHAPAVADSALAALALAMAEEVDKDQNSATAKANCALRLQEALERLREMAPPKQERTKLDELRARRDSGPSAAAG